MNEFFIEMRKYSFNEDKGFDWFLKSFDFDNGSDEWKICRLKSRIYKREAIKHLEQANKLL